MQVWIERIDLENFGPFAGESGVSLGPGLHMVVGPNGAGKSVFLFAIQYAIYGSIPGSTPEQLVHEDEDHMSVGIRLSDGTEITRGWDSSGKTRGKVGGWVELSGVEDARAADVVETWIERTGLSAADFRSTVYLGMGDLGSLVTSGAAARRDQLGGWVVPALWGQLATKAEGRAKALQERVRGVQAALRSIAPGDIADLEERLRGAERARNEASSRMATPEAIRATEHQRQLARAERRWLAEYARIIEAEPVIPDEDPGEPVDTEAHAAKVDRLAQWKSQHAKTQKLARGEFDGPCPVDRVQCPRAEDIRRDLDRHRTRAERQRGLLDKLGAEVAEERDAIRRCADIETRRRWAVKAHESWWKQLADHLDSEPTDQIDLAVLRRRFDERPDVSAIDREIGALQAKIRQAKIDAERVNELDAQLTKLEPELIAWRWMERACGRDGVPAMLLDAAIGEIVDEGNDLLARAGATLRFEFRLQKQLKKSADRCRCGYVFRPRKRKCEECGEPRGLQVDHDCEPLVRDQLTGDISRAWKSSGQRAMLALGLRIGAAAWRMRRAGCAWATLVLDEIEGPLSDDNAAACREVVRAAASLGFVQQLMVSHRAASRLTGHRVIRVTPTGACSRLEVE